MKRAIDKNELGEAQSSVCTHRLAGRFSTPTIDHLGSVKKNSHKKKKQKYSCLGLALESLIQLF